MFYLLHNNNFDSHIGKKTGWVTGIIFGYHMKEFGKESTRLAMADIVNKTEFSVGMIKDNNIKKK